MSFLLSLFTIIPATPHYMQEEEMPQKTILEMHLGIKKRKKELNLLNTGFILSTHQKHPEHFHYWCRQFNIKSIQL